MPHIVLRSHDTLPQHSSKYVINMCNLGINEAVAPPETLLQN